MYPGHTLGTTQQAEDARALLTRPGLLLTAGGALSPQPSLPELMPPRWAGKAMLTTQWSMVGFGAPEPLDGRCSFLVCVHMFLRK